MLFLIFSAILISGCRLNTNEAMPPIIFESSYTGEPRVGNEILATVIIKPYYDSPSDPFYQIDWENITFKSFEYEHNQESFHAAPDLFEVVDYNVIKEKKRVLVDVNIRILREGNGFVKLEYSDEHYGFGTGIEIEAEE